MAARKATTGKVNEKAGAAEKAKPAPVRQDARRAQRDTATGATSGTARTPAPKLAKKATAKARLPRLPHVSYDHAGIEQRWATRWNETGIYLVNLETAERPYYNLMMFPYPSAEGLHVGNMYAFTGADIHGRYMAAKGYDV